VIEKLGGVVFLTNDPQFDTEKVTAYEVGARLQPTPRASFSVSAYYNVYDDLRSVEITPVTFLPIRWGNGIAGKTGGLEAWGNFQAAAWWRLSASLDLMTYDYRFKPGASGILGLSQVGDDPKQQAQLKSSMDLGPDLTWDADLRYVSKLPDPRVPAYGELNSRLAWNVTPRLQLSVSGFNLLHARHIEFAGGEAIPRSVFVGLRVGF
jgi:iron complex outermembrane receptor protein